LLRSVTELSPFFAFLLTGSASLVSALLVMKSLGVMRGEALTRSISWRSALRENWTYGRWLAGSAVLYSLSVQTQTFLAASLLGLCAGGILRAMQLPALVMPQAATAAGLLVLPVLSREFAVGSFTRMHRKAMLVSTALAGTALCFAILLFLWSGRIEQFLFG